MSPLVVLERHASTVFPPHEGRLVVGVRKKIVVDDELLLCVEVKDYRPFDVENIARFRVLKRGALWLKLILG